MSKTNKIILWLVVIIVVVGLIWLGYSEREIVEEGEVIRVGVIACLSGNCAELGGNVLRGVEFAVEDINNKGGVLGKEFEIVVEDSQEYDVKNVISAYQLLKNKGIKYFIGPTQSPAGNVLAPIVSKDEVIITSSSLGISDFNEYSNNIFNTWSHDSLLTKHLAQFAIDKGYKRAGIFSGTQIWDREQGIAFKEEFQRLGGETFKVEPLEIVKDLKTEALKIISFNPDVILITNVANMGIASKELKKLGYEGDKLATWMDETRIKSGQGTLEGTIYVLHKEAEDWFIKSFMGRYGERPSVHVDTSFDAIKLYAKAITGAGTDDIEKVKEILLGIKEYVGASGYMKFDGKGGVIGEPALWIVKNGVGIPYENQ